MGTNDELYEDRGTTDNPSDLAGKGKRFRNEENRQDLETNDVVVVVAYDHLKSTVSVAYKVDPLRQVITGIPVADQGGFLRLYRGLGRNNGTDEGDRRTVGYLVFPKLDSRRAFEDFRRRQPPSTNIFRREGAIFIPMGMFAKADPRNPDVVPPNLVATGPGAAHQVAPEDLALIDPDTGAGIIVKSGGRVVIYAQNVDFVQIGHESDTLKALGGDGDGAVNSLSATRFARST